MTAPVHDTKTAKGETSRGSVFALGNFDGVHRGHQSVVKLALEKAKDLHVPAAVVTLEPHPRTLFRPDIPPFRLTPAAAKIRLLKGLGVHQVVVRDFTAEFAQLPALQFVRDVLIGELDARHIIAGFDYVFGHNRAGNMQTLREWLAPYGIGVTEVTPFRDATGQVMSSSRTRDALQQGDLAAAEAILGRPWSITGIIQQGAQRGRQLSVPTANMVLGDYLRPKFGVYVVQAYALHNPSRIHQGVANIGKRPTVDGVSENLEFHLFDFHDDIYGQEWEVELLHFIRPEQAFGSLDALRDQIMLDIAAAKSWFVQRLRAS